MNNERREKLRGVARKLSDVQSVIEVICDQERDCLDNYPENLQGTERFERAEAAADDLNDALEKLDEVREYIESAMR